MRRRYVSEHQRANNKRNSCVNIKAAHTYVLTCSDQVPHGPRVQKNHPRFAMAALRPCPSAGHVVAVGARRPCMISDPSSSLRVVRALGRQRQASTSLAGHGFGLAGRVASSPRPRHRHGIAVQRGDPDWPLEPCGKGLVRNTRVQLPMHLMSKKNCPCILLCPYN
jgi:hypothetical protein